MDFCYKNIINTAKHMNQDTMRRCYSVQTACSRTTKPFRNIKDQRNERKYTHLVYAGFNYCNQPPVVPNDPPRSLDHLLLGNLAFFTVYKAFVNQTRLGWTNNLHQYRKQSRESQGTSVET
jgi:hypothetical protein